MTRKPTTGFGKAFRISAGLLISAALLRLTFRHVDFSGALEALEKADPVWLAGSVVCSLAVNILLASWQWQVFLRRLGLPLSLAEHAFIKVSLYPLRLLLPSKSGDLTRALYLKTRHDFPLSLGVSSTFFIVGANTGALLLLAFCGSLLGGAATRKMTLLTGAGVLAGLLVLFLIRLMPSAGADPKSLGKIGRLAAKIAPIARLPLGSVAAVSMIGLLTLLVHVFTFYFITRSVGVDLSIGTTLSYTPLIFIAGNLPGTIMGIGAREAATVTLLAGFADKEILLACGLLLTVIDKLLSLLIGAFFFPRFARLSLVKGEKNGPDGD